jgi:hypothetical protein
VTLAPKDEFARAFAEAEARRGVGRSADWVPASEHPRAPVWAVLRGPNGLPMNRRTLFDGHYWLTQEPFSAWRPAPDGEKPVSQLIQKRAGLAPTPIDGLEMVELFAGPAREPETPKQQELLTLVDIARRELQVDVVRVYRPSDASRGTVSGEVLATSRNFVAQHLGGNGVLIHEQDRLNRVLTPGEKVTINYEAGRGQVYNGALLDVNISAPFLKPDQVGWMRMHMLDALSAVDDAEHNDELIRYALQYALRKTTEMFGLHETGIDQSHIRLSVSDVQTPGQIAQANSTGLKIDDLALIEPDGEFAKLRN